MLRSTLRLSSTQRSVCESSKSPTRSGPTCPSPGEPASFPFGCRHRPDVHATQSRLLRQMFSMYDIHALRARVKSFALQLAPVADACAVTTKREKKRSVAAVQGRSGNASAALPGRAAAGQPVRTTIMQCVGGRSALVRTSSPVCGLSVSIGSTAFLAAGTSHAQAR